MTKFSAAKVVHFLIDPDYQYDLESIETHLKCVDKRNMAPWKLDSMYLNVCMYNNYFFPRKVQDGSGTNIHYLDQIGTRTKFVDYNIDELELNPNDLKVSEETISILNLVILFSMINLSYIVINSKFLFFYSKIEPGGHTTYVRSSYTVSNGTFVVRRGRVWREEGKSCFVEALRLLR